MGLKATQDELKASDVEADASGDRLMTVDRPDSGTSMQDYSDDQDDMSFGWLRIEYILADIDGDGIAERVEVIRLRDKILSKEIVSHVPMATTSPILNPHRWDGMSIADLVRDIQKLHTEILRGTLDNLKLTTNPRKKLLTDANGTPMANLDDLLDSRIGGIVRMRSADAVTEEVTSFAGAAAMPMLEYVQGMRENRTGVSRTSMGMNPDSLNNTATGRQIDQNASMQRIELIARIFAETLVKPIFQGILKLLTDGEMQKLSFKLRDEFVEYDPQEWRDGYDMTINVGLGTGDKIQQGQMLTMIYQMQQAGMGMGLATPTHLYHTQSKIIENAGFKDVQNFIQDPSKQPPQPPKPDPAMQVEQMKLQASQQQAQQKLQADMQIEQVRAQAKLQEVHANLELQAANDARDSEREQRKAQFEQYMEQQRMELEKWRAELDARVKLRIAQIGNEQSGAEALGKPNPIDQLALMHSETIQAISQMAETMARPKQIIRDAQGRAQGVA
jgi:predicted RNA-binding protein with PUA-like domain